MPGSVLQTQLAPSSHVNDSLSLYPKTDSGFLRDPGPSSSELTSSMPPLVPPFTGLLSPPASAGALVRAHSAVRRWSARFAFPRPSPRAPGPLLWHLAYSWFPCIANELILTLLSCPCSLSASLPACHGGGVEAGGQPLPLCLPPSSLLFPGSAWAAVSNETDAPDSGRLTEEKSGD